MPELPEQWALFRDRFVTPDGRVIDTGNNDVSHSEGQGYGLLFAAQCRDVSSFERIRLWTRSHLQQRQDDRLHIWRFRPDKPSPVSDHNNATDGDLLIALALIRAGRAWSRSDLLRDAAAIHADVMRLLVHNVAGRTVLLPGVDGFTKPGGVVANLSYLVFPSLIEAAIMAPAQADRERWQSVIQDGLALIGSARFGRWNLPPDWLLVAESAHPRPAKGWPARFSYDAVRIPLYLRWAGLSTGATPNPFRFYWNSFGQDALPAWVDLETDAQAPYPASPGVRAIAECTGLALPPGSLPGALPSIATDHDYYSASLTLLARIVWLEGNPA